MSTTTSTADDTTDANADGRSTLTEPTFGLAVLGGDGEYGDKSRERKAHEQNIAIIPDFDKYGEMRKQSSASYTAYSSSGSEYAVTLTGEELCNCMDARMNDPDDGAGCKHNRKLFKMLDQGLIPAPRGEVHEWVKTSLYPKLVEVAIRRGELQAAREAAANAENPEYAPEEYDDPIETATAIFGGLRDAYTSYRDRVDPTVPMLPDMCRPTNDP